MTLQTQVLNSFSVNSNEESVNSLRFLLDLNLLGRGLNLPKIADVINPESANTEKLPEVLATTSFDSYSETIENDSFDGVEFNSFNSYNLAESLDNSYDLNTSLNFTQASSFSSANYSHFQGSLGADNFTIDTRYSLSVVSGNGNVHYGNGYQDTLDLSHISVNQLSDYDFEVFDSHYDNGGARLFDSLTFSNGSKILLEGIDKIQFSDYEYDLSVDPDDPYFSGQWNLHMMGVQNAWRFTTGSDSVLVGVQDSGLGVFDGNIHPDLRTTFIDSSYNYPDDFNEGFPRNDSHGTGVQGIIAAATDNGIGIAGINWNSDVFNIDVLGGQSTDLSLSDAAESMIAHADANNQNLVINMSLGSNNFHDSEFQQVVENNPNTLFVIAAGNDGHLGQTGISSPAILAQYYDNVIAVGASWGAYDENGFATEPGTRIQYDYWGSQYGPGLTLMGPSEVPSTGAFLDRGFDYHDGFNGTSAAAPNVAGVASLVWSANPDLSAAGIRYILSETAYELGDEDYYGHGFVNADAAVRRAIALSSSSQASTLSSDDFSTASYSSYSSDEADISSFTGSDLEERVTLEEDVIFATEYAYGNVALDSLDHSAIAFGTAGNNEAMTLSEDYFSESLSHDSYSALSNGLGAENLFANAVEI